MTDRLRLVEPNPWNRPEAYRPDPIQMLADNELRLEVTPRIGWFSLVGMSLVAGFIGFALAVGKL